MRISKYIYLTLLSIVISFCAHAEWTETNLRPGEIVVDLMTNDNIKISGSFYYPDDYLSGNNNARTKTYPGIILIHSWLRDRSDWTPLIPHLQKAGYAVIAIDLRNHGQSDGKQYWHKASYDHLTRMLNDAQAAYDYMAQQPFINKNRMAVMGVSIGTIIATRLCDKINHSSKAQPFRAAVMVSPARNYFGVTVSSAIERCTATPFLFAIDKQDPSPTDNKIYTSGLKLYQNYRGKKKLLEFDGTGHGNKMINTLRFIDETLTWLDTYI